MLNLADHNPRRRRPSLTPMIDVVFLLLVFFMLAARFGAPVSQPVELGGQGAGYTGAPRLVTVLPDRLLLNGIEVADLAGALQPLVADPSDVIALRAGDNVTVQRLITVLSDLRAAGYTGAAVVE
ncbi:ExbD/TolR family protein [Thalassococcus lentus]|uniref:Biopolymer transporter ExbD n=1 Tax=Thalassococcus lentus TaxID=1210524 RepID=A0ABT4XTU8_9RHOB|nr:biopolymer transporter ExbD [Thalassococcus lentus]MDA7425342.1 biopolymer transporter ExbD [Thalassococcus lentus]